MGELEAGQPVLACDGLVRRFGDRVAVDGISFTVAAGETYGLLGPNGAGKTTTIRMVCGLLPPHAGEVRVAGRPLRAGDPAGRELVGYVPQDVALYPDLTAEENLRFFGRLYGLSKPDLDERVGEVLDLTGLTDRAGERVDTYSGGMKRRLNIGAGLLHRPSLLVLDEPTVGVDPQSRNAILESVDALGGAGLAVVYTTHYMEEAERLCDRIGIVDRGRLVAEGTRRELVERLAEHDRVELTASGELAGLAAAAGELPAVERVTVADGRVEVIAREARRLLPRLLDLAERCDVDVSAVEVVEPDLEAVFLHLTGTALRE